MRRNKNVPKQLSRRGKATPIQVPTKTIFMRQIELRVHSDLGEYLAERINNNWTLNELAAVLNVSEGTVSRWVSKLVTFN